MAAIRTGEGGGEGWSQRVDLGEVDGGNEEYDDLYLSCVAGHRVR